MALHPDFDRELRRAIRHFWLTRRKQARKQGGRSDSRDAGDRTAVTGGRQMDGFIDLVRDHLSANGVPKTQVFCRKRVELPGWYRPEKQWDLLVVANGELIAGIEFKSQVGSFGNNYNNRTEEAIGSATDIWAAYREGAFKPSARPWLGYMMLLEEAPESTRPVLEGTEAGVSYFLIPDLELGRSGDSASLSFQPPMSRPSRRNCRG